MTATISISEEQINRIMDAIGDVRDKTAEVNGKVAEVDNKVAEIKGTMAAYASGLEEERKAREALGRKVDKHDEILRGDGTYNKPGLIEQVGDVRQKAEDARKEVKQIRTAIWIVGSGIAIPLIVDVIMRLLHMAY